MAWGWEELWSRLDADVMLAVKDGGDGVGDGSDHWVLWVVGCELLVVERLLVERRGREVGIVVNEGVGLYIFILFYFIFNI